MDMAEEKGETIWTRGAGEKGLILYEKYWESTKGEGTVTGVYVVDASLQGSQKKKNLGGRGKVGTQGQDVSSGKRRKKKKKG